MTLIGKKLAISEITPSLDFSSPETQTTWKKTVSHAKRQSLRDIIAIRSTVQDSITQTLRKRQFLHPPVHLFAPCVDPLNHETESPEITYYGQTCSLMQSLIFHKMALLALTDIQDVFWISPNVRKELNVSDKKRYATEFTQIDFESSQLDMESCMQLIEEVITRVIQDVCDAHGEAIERISGRKLQPIQGKMKRYDAVEEAERRGVPEKDIEKILAKEETQPFFLTNLLREAYDMRDDATGKFLNYDVIMPVTGEVLSGAQREFTHDRLKMRMEELGYPLEYFAPILELAKEHGLVQSAGGGFGVERIVRGILLLEDIAEVYPFARVPEEKIIF